MMYSIDLDGDTRDQAMEDISIETMSRKPVLYQPSRTVLTYPSEAFQEKLLCDGLTLNMGNACVYDRTGPLVWDGDRLLFVSGLGLDARAVAAAPGGVRRVLRWIADHH